MHLFYPSAKMILKHPTENTTILLVKRTVGEMYFYEPAGGKVNIDFKEQTAESLEQCALREIKEELGIIANIERYIGSYYVFWASDPNKCSSCALFVGTIVDQDQHFIHNTDIHESPLEPVWVTYEDIASGKVLINARYKGLKNSIMRYFETVL